MRGIAQTVAFLVILGLGTGCSTVRNVVNPDDPPATSAPPEVSDSTITYSAGAASRVFAVPASTMHPPVLAAMEDLRFTNVRRFNDSGVVLFQGTTADNRRVSLTLRSPTPSSVRATVRIGLFGDEPMSKAVIERIGVRLGELPPAPIPTEIPSTPTPNPFFNFKRMLGPDSEMLRDMADSRYRDTTIP